MATKSANVYVRIEPDIKEQAESILNDLGITVSNAIQMYYKQIILHQGLPFDVKIPARKPVSISDLTKEELDKELQKGYSDMLEGRTRPAEEVFADLEKDYGL